MKKRTLVREEGGLVYFRLEDSDGTFCCSPTQWKLDKLRERVLIEFKVPAEILEELEDLSREVSREFTEIFES